MSKKAKYWDRKNQGLCTNCRVPPKPALQGSNLCSECKEKARFYYRRKRDNRKCTKCSKPSASLVRCSTCLTKENNQQRRSRRKLYEKKLCQNCKEKPRRESRIYCTECAIKSVARMKSVRERRKAEKDICNSCPRKVMEGRKSCKDCLRRERIKSRNKVRRKR